jgi:hypothetical protein
MTVPLSLQQLYADHIKVWFLHASTGCSCCREDNFEAGPFKTEADASERAEAYRSSRRLSSQYSRTGNYTVSDAVDAELLPDGRIIVEDRVYSEWGGEHQW